MQIADRAISKFINHLYYLYEERVAFNLFDDRVDVETKSKIIENILMFSEEEPLKEIEEIKNKNLLKIKI